VVRFFLSVCVALEKNPPLNTQVTILPFENVTLCIIIRVSPSILGVYFRQIRETASIVRLMEEVGGRACGGEPGETGDVHADGSWGVVGKEDGVWGVGESQQGGKEVSRPC